MTQEKDVIEYLCAQYDVAIEESVFSDVTIKKEGYIVCYNKAVCCFLTSKRDLDEFSQVLSEANIFHNLLDAVIAAIGRNPYFPERLAPYAESRIYKVKPSVK